jgi:hypothetical protein
MKKSLLAVVAAIALVAVVSVVAVRSSDDGPRRQGALEEGEAVSLTWRGEWSPDAKYAQGSVVSHAGGTYVAEAATAGDESRPGGEGAAPAGGWTPLASEAALTPGPSLTSPNGSFKIEVDDTGILLSGPNVSVLMSADSLTAQLPKEFQVQAGTSVNVKAGATLNLESSSNAVVRGSILTLGCAGTGARPVARINDTVTNSTIVSGSSKVFAC